MKIELIGDWKKAYAFYSMWFFAILGVTPQLFNLAVQSGLISSSAAPAALAYVINMIAFMGAASRLIQQKKEELAKEQPSDTPTAAS